MLGAQRGGEAVRTGANSEGQSQKEKRTGLVSRKSKQKSLGRERGHGKANLQHGEC